MPSIDYCSWEDIDRLSRQLAAKINEPFDAIVCVMRGGAIPGTILANELNIDLVLGIKVVQNGQVNSVLPSSKTKEQVPYQGERGEIIVPLNNLDLNGLRVLVVDDVLDSGESARLVIDNIQHQNPETIKLATLHIKSYTQFKSDYYMEEKTNWLFYPWMSRNELAQMKTRLTEAEKATKKEKKT